MATTETARPATYAELQQQARAICAAQPGYGSPAYRGDPYEAVALQQQAERMVHDMARKIVGEDVRYCVSGIVAVLIAGATDNGGESIVDEEDGYTLSQRAPDADDYRDALQADSGVTVTRDADGDGVFWRWSYVDPDGELVDGGEEDSELEAYRAAFDAADLDTPDGSEIFEHWLVTDWLARKLRAQGESVVDDLQGLTVWGRATTGQAIYMDSSLQAIARAVLEA